MNFTPLPNDLLPASTHQKFFKFVFIFFSIVILASGAIWYFSKKLIKKDSQLTAKIEKPTPFFTPTPPLKMKTDWKEFVDNEKGVSFKYPPDWTISESDGFLNSTHIKPPDESFEIIISEGQIPYDFGRAKIKKSTIPVAIGDKTYDVEEQTADSKKLFDFQIDLPQETHFLVRTDNIPSYEAKKNIILSVIASIKFIHVQPTNVPSGWQEFNDFGFRLYYPPDMQIQSQSDTEVIWNGMILRSLAQPFKKLKENDSILIDTNKNKTVPVSKMLEEKKIKVGDIDADKYIFSCGPDCNYYMLRVIINELNYELIFDSTRNKEAIFDSIIGAISLK